MRALTDELREQHPVMAMRVPLAIGFKEQLRAAHPEVSRRLIGRVMFFHTRCSGYLQSCAAGGPRYNIDGTRNGEVTEAQIAHARRAIADVEAQLARRKEERRKAKEQAAKGRANTGRPILTLKRGEKSE